MQIPLLAGITATEQADFNLSYPVNLEPVPIDSGISAGYLRSAAGAITLAGGPGVERGGIVWNNTHYRVMGTKLVSVSGATVTELADVGAGGPVGLDYGFGRLAIQSGTSLYFWDGSALTQVTDPDLGQCLDVVWYKGQYFSTDGNYIVAMDINNPLSVNPLKYGSAESDPDMVTGMIKVRDELLAFGGNTVEFFDYVGGSGFPLRANPGATIPVGCVGPRAKCLFAQSAAFVGGGRNQGIGVWAVGSGTAQKLSSRTVDDILSAEQNAAGIELEARVSRDEERLYVHLTSQSLVYYKSASQAAGKPVWGILKSGRGTGKAYRLRHPVLCDGKWIVGDTETSNLGTLTDDTGSHFGEAVGWRFDTQLLYNQAKGAIIHSLELTGLPGRGSQSPAPSAYISYTDDGETWSMERAARLGLAGARRKRTIWNPHKRFRNYLGLRFRGDSDSLAGWAALEAEIEPLKA